MKKIIITDDLFLISLLSGHVDPSKDVILAYKSRGFAQKVIAEAKQKDVIKFYSAKKAFLTDLKNYADPHGFVLLKLQDPSLVDECINQIRAISNDTAIAVVDASIKTAGINEDNTNLFSFSLSDIILKEFEFVLKKIETRQKLEHLKQINQQAENILILTQNDPDPDALASGLALRVLLGRNKLTAPIGSFGKVTRSENINMVSLLDIPVVEITPEMLDKFSKIAMVDVQPPYFKNMDIKTDIVIDHHLYQDKYTAQYRDIRTAFGATSTILAEYLIFENYKITQRLATALYYGIKTDTMFLGRDMSQSDIDVFTYLYPYTNLNMVRQIEHPNLQYNELTGFVKALKDVNIVDKMLFTYLGKVEKEDIIPRIADFCLQIGEVQWSFVSALIDNNVVCSIRNVGYVKHAGELANRAFGNIGSAGGHRSMAKAVISVEKFKKNFNTTIRKGVKEKIIEQVINAMEKNGD